MEGVEGGEGREVKGKEMRDRGVSEGGSQDEGEGNRENECSC